MFNFFTKQFFICFSFLGVTLAGGNILEAQTGTEENAKGLNVTIPFDQEASFSAVEGVSPEEEDLAIIENPLTEFILPGLRDEKWEAYETRNFDEKVKDVDLASKPDEAGLEFLYEWVINNDAGYGKLVGKDVSVKVGPYNYAHIKPVAFEQKLPKRHKETFNQFLLEVANCDDSDAVLKSMDLSPKGDYGYRLVDASKKKTTFYNRVEEKFKNYWKKVYQNYHNGNIQGYETRDFKTKLKGETFKEKFTDPATYRPYPVNRPRYRRDTIYKHYPYQFIVKEKWEGDLKEKAVSLSGIGWFYEKEEEDDSKVWFKWDDLATILSERDQKWFKSYCFMTLQEDI